MRFIGMFVFVCSLAATTACDLCDDPSGQCGGLNQTCGNWVPCQEGLRCVNDTCVSCGHPGEVCCWTAVGPDECENSVCDETQDATPTCSDKCGIVGAPCCGGTDCPDPAGASCNQATNTCEAMSTPAPCGSGPEHVVVFVNQFGCTVDPPVTFHSSAPDECIAALLAELGPGFTAGPVDTFPTNCEERCQYWDDMPDASTGADEVGACAFSAAALDSCFNSLCSDCLYTNEPANTCGDMY